MSPSLVSDLLDGFDKPAGVLRLGFRPVPAKGLMHSDKFIPLPEAAKKTADSLAAELSERLAKVPVILRVLVSRPQAEFGTLTITERVDELAP